MRLVPRQLRRAGMTGNVPYYGGRLTPDQAYAASHPPPPPSQLPPPAAPPVARNRPDLLSAIQDLLDTGVITAEEYRELRTRVRQ
jgi:hypothetical protein